MDHKTPGQLIEALLDERGWSQRVLAVVLGMDETTLSAIIRGKRSVTAELALSLADVFDAPPDRFLQLQREWDLARARLIARPDPDRATRAILFGDLPVTDMIRRGWLDATNVRNAQEVEAALKKFFGVAALNEIEILPHAPKKTPTTTPVTPAQRSWSRSTSSPTWNGRRTGPTRRLASAPSSSALRLQCGQSPNVARASGFVPSPSRPFARHVGGGKADASMG